MTITLREEIIDILKDVYSNNDQADPFDEVDADRILKLFEKRVDELGRINTPQNCNNISVRERQNIQYYRLALGDVKELLK